MQLRVLGFSTINIATFPLAPLLFIPSMSQRFCKKMGLQLFPQNFEKVELLAGEEVKS